MKMLMSIVVAVALMGCGVVDSDCVAGEPCVCAGAGACTQTCVGGGCTFEVPKLSAGQATFRCPDGGCTLEAGGAGEVTFDCPGGGCTAEAFGDGALTLICPKNCTLKCNGTGACTLKDCDDACEIDCAGAIGSCDSV